MASIKERMVQVLNSKGIDTSEIDISKNPPGVLGGTCMWHHPARAPGGDLGMRRRRSCSR